MVSIGTQNVSYDARQHHLLEGLRQSKKQQVTRLKSVMILVPGQTGLILHGNNRQTGITKLLGHVMTSMLRMELVMEVFHMQVQ